MDERQFWQLIEESKRASKGDLDAQPELLQERLEKLAPADIVRFDRIYHDQIARSYTWDLWGAAYVIGGGCSDDGFDYFRDWLVSRGRTVFEAALRDPETLAGVVTDEDLDEGCNCEELRYAAVSAWESRTEESADDFPAEDGAEPPDEPTGVSWKDATELVRRFPKLTAKFG